MDAKITIKKRAAVLLTASGLMLAMGAGVGLAATFNGDNGPDRLIGSAQNDVLRGFGGKDFINGKANSDRMFGGAGNDIIIARDSERDFVNCGPGRDTVVSDTDNEDCIMGNCEVVKKPLGEAPDAPDVRDIDAPDAPDFDAPEMEGQEAAL